MRDNASSVGRRTDSEASTHSAIGASFMEKVIIYKNDILNISETFIRNQAAAVSAFEMHFAGLGPVRGPSLSGLSGGEPVLLTNNHTLVSRLRRSLFKQSGLGTNGFLRSLAQLEPSLIHAHFAQDGTVAMKLAERLGVPFVTTLHGYDVTMRDEFFSKTRNGRSYLRSREQLWSRCSHFFASCAYIRNRAIEAGFPGEKIEVLYSGHDRGSFHVSKQPRNPNLIVYVGRLVEKKGGPYLVRAAALAAKQHPSLELAIIGDGPLRAEMEELARESGINCRFLGRLLNLEPGNTVFDWLSRARVFCMPSVTAANGDSEGQPAVFVEAHALGTPAVSFQSAGIGEVVLDGETGFLAPEKDVVALASRLVQLLTDDALWARFSERARTWVWDRFDSGLINQQLELAYRRVIDAYGR